MYSILENNKHNLSKVKKIPGLVEWIDHNCNPELLTPEFNHDKILHFKIYNIFNPNIPIRCTFGKPLHYSTKRRRPVCTLSCTCWREAADIKYKQTLMEKYGVDHISKVPTTIINKSKNNLEKYGKPHTFQVDEFKDKSRATCLEKYGTDTTATVAEFIEKRKETNLERYGVEYASASSEVRDKIKATNVERYGFESSLQNEDVRKKSRKTMLARYGVLHPIQNEEIKNNTQSTNMKRYGVPNPSRAKAIRDKRKQTNCERYGFENVMTNPEIKEKAKKTCLKKYGTVNFNQYHISPESYDILNSKERFTECLLEYGRNGAATQLGVSLSLISQRHKLYELSILSSASSSYERELSHWLTINGIDHQCGNRTICYPNEIDIYIPSHKLAIEFNGLYWHSEAMGKDRNYHILKTKQCAAQDIRLIHIFEDEWVNRKDICKNIIAMSMGICNYKIHARKCTVDIVTNKEIQSFSNDNHLQGHCAASVNLVLKYKDEIIMVMSFSHPRYNKNVQWELLRLASRNGYHIMGGAEKLWSHFRKTYSPSSIVSYCDKRWFTGGIYTKLGFLQNGIASATYWYTDLQFRYHRSKFTKQRAINEALKISNEYTREELQELTESSIMNFIVGMYRIWDCGQDTYIWKEHNEQSGITD